MTTLKRDIGSRIKTARIARGLNQKELAALIGVTDRAISSYEVGDSVPSAMHAISLAEHLGVTLDFLLAGKQP